MRARVSPVRVCVCVASLVGVVSCWLSVSAVHSAYLLALCMCVCVCVFVCVRVSVSVCKRERESDIGSECVC
jgi:hypothetical protein